MLVTKPYIRENALQYASRYALSQNPIFGNFAGIGGNCTNFVSQCVYAGTCKMNYKETFGWYYISMEQRAPAWTGVEFFYRCLVGNVEGIGNGAGSFAKEVQLSDLEIGDFVQFGRATGDFYHTPIVVGFSNGEPLLAAHSYDAFGRRLRSYTYERLRCLHILGARK